MPLGAVLDAPAVPPSPRGRCSSPGSAGCGCPARRRGRRLRPPEDLRARGPDGGGVAALDRAAARGPAGSPRPRAALGYLAAESAGQCGPCMFGLPAIAADMTALAGGRGGAGGLARLRQRLDVDPRPRRVRAPGRGGAVAASALRVFADDVTRHAAGAPCACDRRARLPVPGRCDDPTERLAVDPIACRAHGLCAEMLPDLVRLDEWGYPILHARPGAPRTPPCGPRRRRGLPDARPAAAPGLVIDGEALMRHALWPWSRCLCT